MARFERSHARLSAREREVIDHVARHRLTTIAALRNTQLRDLTRRAASKVVGHLCDAGFLCGYPLIYPTRYYVLGKEAVRALGLPRERTLPLGPQSLPTAVAALNYAALGKRTRKLLNRSELLEMCPWLSAGAASAPHCLDDAENVLELLRVDLGGPPDHVARKCVTDIRARERYPEFTALARRGRFRLVLLTSTTSKASALRHAIDRHDWPPELPIHFSIISDLLALTARKHDA